MEALYLQELARTALEFQVFLFKGIRPCLTQKIKEVKEHFFKEFSVPL